MELIAGLHGRRSIRKYTAAPVTEADLRTLLAAAVQAPSAGNQQPWEFIVIRERQTLEAIPQFHPHAAMLRQAPVAIVVCGNTAKETYQGYWVQDCSAAVENLLLAAHGLGLGAVWLGVYPNPERVAAAAQLLGLPTGVIPMAIISLGHPAEQRGPAQRDSELCVHWERW